jgi:hypothetical protein
MVILYICISIMSLLWLRKINIKNVSIIRTGFEKDNTSFSAKVLSVFLFFVTITSFVTTIYVILNFFNKTEGAFPAYTYFISTTIYLVFTIEFISKKKDDNDIVN